ncbi:TRAP transporter small permease subunit [Salinarimonas ramus]|uniref:TRAP transporter small permease protein n=1 Tax=Salinarimonas ramus TaxID=690164 RepID=A0A917Q9E3_9HYPH|nr:TRAP transporter small permease subunit [Salinarimonas ramus]GGK37572.1 transporter DctQ-related protein [Salinarimonas ramus]
MRFVEALCARTGRLASLLVLPMIAIVLFEVSARYAFGAPTIWAGELVQILFGALFFLCGAEALKARAHVQVDLLHQAVGPRMRAGLNGFAHLLVLAYLLVLGFIVHERVIEAVARLERTRTPWDPPIWPSWVVVALSIVLMALQALAIALRELRTAMRGPAERAP